MKLESLKKFQDNEMNKVEMNNVFGGVAEGWATAGSKETCSGIGCGSYDSDWEDKNGIYYYGFKGVDKSC